MASSTRPLEIFQDPTSCTHPDMRPESVHNSTAPLSRNQPSPRNKFGPTNVIFTPPLTTLTGRSPLKAVSQARKSPSKSLHRGKQGYFPPPQIEIFRTDSPNKMPTASRIQSLTAQKAQKAQKALTTFCPDPRTTDKENTAPTFPGDHSAEVVDLGRDSKVTSKKRLIDAAPLQDQQPKKPRLQPKHDTRLLPVSEDLPTLQLPAPGDMPPIEDSGSKPPYSYAQLIGMSILRAQTRRLTLAQIYRWISDSFSHYRATDLGWQNSIRHNLSLNKAFIKQERPKDDPGKGNYWAIKPGMEMHFLKEKPNRRPSSSFGPNLRIFAQSPSEGNSIALPTDIAPAAKADVQASDIFLLSSDATIPASAISQEDEFQETTNMPPPSRLPFSSPLQMIHSSPPVAPRFSNIDSSPHRPDLPLPSSRPSSRKRGFPGMDDSGYFSSLNSSAIRPYQPGNSSLVETGGDRKRMRGGRAEVEIARIRSSSHEISPTKGRPCFNRPNTEPFSSSPLRHFDSSGIFPPLTPVVKFKLPTKPPASVSPNTNLRNHRNKIRELVGSPRKNIGLLNDEIPFSPAFNIDEQCSPNSDFISSFDIFSDKPRDACIFQPSASIKKRSVPRARFDRASKTGNILASITGTILNRKVLASGSNTALFDSPTHQKTSKLPHAFSEDVINPEREDIFGLNLSNDEEPDDFGGLDILQGFQKIGGNKNLSLTPSKPSRPAVGARGQISRFDAI